MRNNGYVVSEKATIHKSDKRKREKPFKEVSNKSYIFILRILQTTRYSRLNDKGAIHSIDSM